VRIENLSLNTVVSGFMEYTNKLSDLAKTTGGVDFETLEKLTIMLAPFAPHIAEELWEQIGCTGSVFAQKWPEYDAEKIKSDEMTIVLQINGKLRDSINVAAYAGKDAIVEAGKNALARRLEGVEVVKEIYVPGKLVNFVVK